MNTQYCKVEKIQPVLPDSLDLNQLEQQHLSFIEEAYNLHQTDASLSDILYYEARKLKQLIANVKQVLTKDLDVSL
ncbi:MAG: hypothetical protein ACI83H_001549 [Glaciecola sp.]|jgi:hypothetical protein